MVSVIIVSVFGVAGTGCHDDVRSSDAGADLDDGAPRATSDGAVSPDLASVPRVRLADVVHEAPGATGGGFGDPQRAVNGVAGTGTGSGSLDVYSLGYGANDYLTLAWSEGGVLRNGPGADLAIFENPFNVNSSVSTFMDLVIVELSRDGVTWVALPHDYTAADETAYASEPALWQGFAGRTPVKLNQVSNPVDPFDPLAAGGDAFDLDSLPDDGGAATTIRTQGARYIRLVTAPSRVNPDSGVAYPRDGLSNGADIDGVYGRYVVP